MEMDLGVGVGVSVDLGVSVGVGVKLHTEKDFSRTPTIKASMASLQLIF